MIGSSISHRRQALPGPNELAQRISRPTRRRAAVYRRAFRRELSRLREPRRIVAIALLGVTGGLMLAILYARGDLAGADARAYWAGVRVWLAGGDPYHPPELFMPYPYAPWLLPVFLPWALLPWNVAWFFWRGLNMLLFLWTAEWAYRRRPLATALVITALSLPLAATFDTGNITLGLALMIWAAQFVGPRLGGLLWALTVMTKWFPALLLVFLPPRSRLWAFGWLAVAIVLSLATLPATVNWVQTMVSFPRPVRVDYLLLLWAAIPWFWRHPHPLWWANRRELPGVAARLRASVRGWWLGWRTDPEHAATIARRGIGQRLRAFFGVT